MDGGEWSVAVRKQPFFGSYEYQQILDVDDLPAGDNFATKLFGMLGVEFFYHENFSLMASYDNRFLCRGRAISKISKY